MKKTKPPVAPVSPILRALGVVGFEQDGPVVRAVFALKFGERRPYTAPDPLSYLKVSP